MYYFCPATTVRRNQHLLINRAPTLNPGPCLVFLDPAKKGLRYPNLKSKTSLLLQLKLNLFLQSVLLITLNSAVPLLTAASLISAHLFCSSMLLIILAHHPCCSHHHSVRHIILIITMNTSCCCQHHPTIIISICSAFGTSYVTTHFSGCNCPVNLIVSFSCQINVVNHEEVCSYTAHASLVIYKFPAALRCVIHHTFVLHNDL